MLTVTRVAPECQGTAELAHPHHGTLAGEHTYRGDKRLHEIKGTSDRSSLASRDHNIEDQGSCTFEVVGMLVRISSCLVMPCGPTQLTSVPGPHSQCVRHRAARNTKRPRRLACRTQSHVWLSNSHFSFLYGISSGAWGPRSHTLPTQFSVSRSRNALPRL
jgi:hypothetical protein